MNHYNLGQLHGPLNKTLYHYWWKHRQSSENIGHFSKDEEINYFRIGKSLKYSIL